jgi:hypothetical protein
VALRSICQTYRGKKRKPHPLFEEKMGLFAKRDQAANLEHDD